MVNLFAASIFVSCIIMIPSLTFWILRRVMPPKPPSNKNDDPPRICGFKYSTKEDIDKLREEISKYKF